MLKNRQVRTQLNVADPDALLALLQDLLEVDAGEAAGAARHQNRRHAHQLGARQGGVLLGGRRGLGGPLRTRGSQSG